MGTLTDKLNYLLATKGLIKTAIQSKGQTVLDTDTFRSYAAKIDAIPTVNCQITDAGYLFYRQSRLTCMEQMIALFTNVTRFDYMIATTAGSTVPSPELTVPTSLNGKLAYMVDANSPYNSISNMFAGNLSNSNFYSSPYHIKSIPDLGDIAIETAVAVNASNMFYGQIRLEEILGLDMRHIGTTSTMFGYCPRLRRLLLKGYHVRTSFSIANCAFDRAGMVEMFNSLGTKVVTGTVSITITGNPCVTDGSLTAEDKLIATNKGYTLITA